MNTNMSRTFRRVTVAALSLVAIVAAMGGVARAQDSATLSIPSTISFTVSDVTKNTPADNNPQVVSFSSATFATGDAVQFTIEANSDQFTPPGGGGTIPASNIQWKGAGVNGTVTTGTMSNTGFGTVFTGNANAISGSANIWFRLLGPLTGIAAGSHTLTCTWKVAMANI